MSTPTDHAWIRWTGLGLGLAFLWAAYLALFGPTLGMSDAPALAGTALAAPAPYAWKLRDLRGKVIELGEFRGRPILLNLWATWCPPCRAEMPALARLAEDRRIKSGNVAVVCVSLDDDPEVVRRFLGDKTWGMTMLHADALPGAFQTDGIPATFLIDPSGRIVAHQVGPAEWDDPSVVDFLLKLAPKG